VYERGAGKIVNCGRAKVDKDGEREGGGREVERRDERDKRDGNRATYVEEENGIGEKGSRKREVCVEETRNPKFISICGGACSDSASVAFSPFRSQNSELSMQLKRIANLIVLPGNYFPLSQGDFFLLLR